MLKQALAFAAGIAVGTATTYLICKKKYDQKMNQELEDMKSYYNGVMILHESDIRKDQIAKDVKDIESDANFGEKPEGPTEDTYTRYGSLADIYKRNGDSTPPSDADIAGRMENDEPDMEEEEFRKRKAAKARRAAKMRDQYPSEDDEENYDDLVDEDEEDIQMDDPIDPSMSPYEITLDSFNHDFPYFDKLTVNYYPDDGLLVDENEEYIDDPNRLFGSFHEAHRVAGAETYIRNESIGADFIIITKPGSYLGKEDYS